MTFDVTQGQIYTQDTQFDWQGIDGLTQAQQEQIQAGNYGSIQNVVMDGDRLIIQTDLGTMTFTGPELDAVEGELKLEGFIETGIKLEVNQAMFDVFAALALLLQTAMEMRKASREARFAEMETVFSLNMAAADKLRESANWALAGAIIGGAISIGMGAVSIAGGMKMTKMASQMETATVKPTQTTEIEMTDMSKSKSTQVTQQTQQELQAMSSNKAMEMKINALNQKLMGWNSISQGMSQIVKGVGDFGSQTTQAEAKEEEARASKRQAFQDDAKEFMDEAGKLIDAVRDSLRAIQDSEAQAMRTILRS